MAAMRALTSGSAVHYGSELWRDRKTLENISRHRLSRPTNSDVGQLGAEVVKSCMKTKIEFYCIFALCM